MVWVESPGWVEPPEPPEPPVASEPAGNVGGPVRLPATSARSLGSLQERHLSEVRTPLAFGRRTMTRLLQASVVVNRWREVRRRRPTIIGAGRATEPAPEPDHLQVRLQKGFQKSSDLLSTGQNRDVESSRLKIETKSQQKLVI